MPFKITYFFKSTPKAAGWSETYYTQALNFGTALPIATGLAATRAQLLSDNASLGYLRVSDINNPHTVQVVDYTNQPLQPSNVVGADPWNALLFRLTASNGRFRPLYMRDIPADAAAEGANLRTILSGAYWQVIQKFILAVLNANPAFSLLEGNPASNAIPITVLGGDTDTRVLVTTTLAHGLTTGDKTRLSRIKTYPQLNKTWTVTVIDAFNFTLNYSFWPGASLTTKGEGRSLKVTRTLFDVIDCEPERIVHRIVGRPFDLQRGRRRKTA